MQAALLLAGLALVSSLESAAADGCYIFLPTADPECASHKCYFGSVCRVLDDYDPKLILPKGSKVCECDKRDCSKAYKQEICTRDRDIFPSYCHFEQKMCLDYRNIAILPMFYCRPKKPTARPAALGDELDFDPETDWPAHGQSVNRSTRTLLSTPARTEHGSLLGASVSSSWPARGTWV